jgi:hypothetical protein
MAPAAPGSARPRRELDVKKEDRIVTRPLVAVCSTLLALWCSTSTSAQQASDTAVDNGTDPTKFSNAVFANYEYVDLKQGIRSGTLRLNYVAPLGAIKDYALRFRVPVAMNDVFGNNNHDLGDMSVLLQHVFGLTKERAFVWQAEVAFDTASRPELGTGKHVFSPTLIYARFLEGGAIFAPAIKHSLSFGGDSKRAKVNATALDFYYVPKLADARNLVTIDPALSLDWESDKRFASVAVTFGRVIGPMFGGNGIVSIKPTLFAGGDRPGKWGIEVGFKVLGF